MDGKLFSDAVRIFLVLTTKNDTTTPVDFSTFTDTEVYANLLQKAYISF